MDLEEVVAKLNQWQEQGLIKITNYENLTISLRPKLKNNIDSKAEQWIENWSKLWHGKKSKSGYYLTQPVKENADRLYKYMKLNPTHTPEIITQATINYLEEKKKVGYEFCSKSNKFILSENGSVLYAYCEAIINKEEQTKPEVEWQ